MRAAARRCEALYCQATGPHHPPTPPALRGPFCATACPLTGRLHETGLKRVYGSAPQGTNTMVETMASIHRRSCMSCCTCRYPSPLLQSQTNTPVAWPPHVSRPRSGAPLPRLCATPRRPPGSSAFGSSATTSARRASKAKKCGHPCASQTPSVGGDFRARMSHPRRVGARFVRALHCRKTAAAPTFFQRPGSNGANELVEADANAKVEAVWNEQQGRKAGPVHAPGPGRTPRPWPRGMGGGWRALGPRHVCATAPYPTRGQVHFVARRQLGTHSSETYSGRVAPSSRRK